MINMGNIERSRKTMVTFTETDYQFLLRHKDVTPSALFRWAIDIKRVEKNDYTGLSYKDAKSLIEQYDILFDRTRRVIVSNEESK